MSKHQIEANELLGADVNFVSLVKRGANRIPFRITKEDGNMIDLHKIGRGFFKKADPKPEIVAAIVQKGADLAKVAAIFAAAGLELKDFAKSEKDGIVSFAKADAESAEGAALLKVSEEVGLLVSGLKKAFGTDYDSTSFSERVATEGFYSSACVAVDVLKSVVSNILYEAESSADAAADVGSAVDELKTYLVALTNGLPVQAFKADVEVSRAGSLAKADASASEAAELENAEVSKTERDAEKVSVSEPAKKGESVSENPVAGSTTTDTSLGTKRPDNNIDEDPAEGNATPPASGGKSNVGEKSPSNDVEGNPAVTKSSETDKDKDQELDDSKSGAGAEDRGPKAPAVKTDESKVLEAIAALRKSVDEAIAAVKQDVAAVSDRVDQVAVQAKKTDEALHGTVFNETVGDAANVKKADAPIPLLDTAYSRRTA
ncbi:hypothetical protein [Hyphomicrobium sp.]|uniref:hypothetical protein n=1 Tax=Hyphomicrobium sp. TaxID=82 RepID=UPI001D581704|nr:hypothetical protein [Hyphomicrobium sp.]MBY0559999.1 hypothetical protein [Hyphomicrobium sp.]